MVLSSCKRCAAAACDRGSTKKYHRFDVKLTRRKRVLLLAALTMFAVAGLAVAWHMTVNGDNRDENWVDDLASIRGPRDAWDFVTGRLSGTTRR